MHVLTSSYAVAVLTLNVDYVVFLGAGNAVIEMLEAKLMERFEMMAMGDVSLVFGVKVTRDHEKGILTISQANYTEAVSEKLGMGACNVSNTPGAGPEVVLKDGR